MKYQMIIKINSIIVVLILLILKGYQIFLSPLLVSNCRFKPSCSDYAYQAVNKYGPYKGTFLSLKRILCCHPFHPGGFDPVP